MDSADAVGAGDGGLREVNLAPLITIPLRDGRVASIAPDALRLGDESFALDRLQDARQIVPEPPTIALRVAGRGLVEFTPVDAHDGQLLLEAIYRLRPELRPRGFDAPSDVPHTWQALGAAPPAPLVPAWPVAPTSGPYAAGPATGPGTPYPYASPSTRQPRVPATPDGSITSYPRDVVGLIGATFRLYLSHWREWLLLGLFAAGLPSLASGALQMALYAVQGHNPWRAIDTTVVTIIPTHLPRAGELFALLTLGLLLILALIVTSAWQVAVFSDAARRALLGEPLDVRASLVAGVRRFVPVLLVTLALAGAVLVAVGVPTGLLLLVSAQVGPNPNTASLSVALSACLGLVWLVVGAGALAYGAGRLLLAPYLAATQPLDPRSAIQASWRLTRGHWWHAVAPILVVGLVVLLVSSPVGEVELLSYALEMLLAQPLANAVLSPLLALAAVAVLGDLRLRAEGYEAVLHKPFT